jgi:hypothetical protein
MLVGHPTLDWKLVATRTLQVRITADGTGARVTLEVEEDRRPGGCHAEHPRMVGRNTVVTPWVVSGTEFPKFEGLRVAMRTEAAWDLPEGVFAYFRGEIISIAVVS